MSCDNEVEIVCEYDYEDSIKSVSDKISEKSGMN